MEENGYEPYDEYLLDVCYECTGYGDDYWINDEGELESYCSYCPFNEALNEEGVL